MSHDNSDNLLRWDLPGCWPGIPGRRRPLQRARALAASPMLSQELHPGTQVPRRITSSPTGLYFFSPVGLFAYIYWPRAEPRPYMVEGCQRKGRSQRRLRPGAAVADPTTRLRPPFQFPVREQGKIAAPGGETQWGQLPRGGRLQTLSQAQSATRPRIRRGQPRRPRPGARLAPERQPRPF